MTKEFLSKENAQFEEHDVTQDREALKEMVEVAGVRTVPVITGCGEVIVGFNKEKILEMVKCVKS
jgi:glutaredoxin